MSLRHVFVLFLYQLNKNLYDQHTSSKLQLWPLSRRESWSSEVSCIVLMCISEVSLILRVFLRVLPCFNKASDSGLIILNLPKKFSDQNGRDLAALIAESVPGFIVFFVCLPHSVTPLLSDSDLCGATSVSCLCYTDYFHALTQV